ncbi:rhombotarget A [Acinetobacter indicus]|uniref:rhombotarget A n=1 Tax=Acinetobacter indicus TaxID=756892 RepID=UPI00144490FD|nr:rhombotarget A [Acinetobacter indicus]
MLKRSIGIGMLFIAGHAYSSNIVVTITEDIQANDKECSLREAVEYINLGLPEEGHNGCGGENSSNVILLEKHAVYKLNQQLKITQPLSIKTTYDTGLKENNIKGLNNAIIEMAGNERIFHIESSDDKRIQVNLSEVSLQGCGSDSCRPNQGGLILNHEYLVLDYVKLSQGRANQGGAIYNLAEVGENIAPAFIEIKNSLIQHNHATEGGAIYSRLPSFRIYAAVFSDNKTSDLASANLYTQLPTEDVENLKLLAAANTISSTTFNRNEGYVLNLRDNIGVNNVTLMGNSAGVRLEAPAGKGYIANSILLANPHPVTAQSANCSKEAADQSVLQNNLVSEECGLGDTNYPNQIWQGSHIFSGNILEGACKVLSEDEDALFCPYQVKEEQFLGYIRPRILLNYQALADSPIVNKGYAQVGTTEQVTCASADQRGVNRASDNTLCDRGAIEITVPDASGLIGRDILAGEIAEMSVSDLIGDSDLVPAEFCDSLFSSNPTGKAWQAGCVQIEQTQTSSKGQLTIDEQGKIIYTPDSAWHGADVFKIKLVTSSTRFNTTKPYVEIRVQVIQAPENHMDSDKIKTSGGAVAGYGVLMLMLLAAWRRKK